MNEESKNLHIGAKIRKYRRALGLNQAQLAEKLGKSVTYINLIENNQRRISLNLLLALSKVFDISVNEFIIDADHRILGECMEILADAEFDHLGITNQDIKQFVDELPQMANAMVAIHQKYTEQRAENNRLSQVLLNSGVLQTPTHRAPNEILIEFMQNHKNYFPSLEVTAQEIRQLIGGNTTKKAKLIEFLNQHDRVQVIEDSPSIQQSYIRHYDSERRVLHLAENLYSHTKFFQIAYTIAWIHGKNAIMELIDENELHDSAVKPLFMTMFANYLAAAIIMPYNQFFTSAQKNRYDIELLQNEFRVSFEQICHRLTTLNNPDEQWRGVPMHYIKTDRAGNISKRFSLSGIPISRLGSACPKWNMYDALQRPEELVIGVQQFPDGSAYLNISQAIRKGQRGFMGHHSTVAITIGCDIKYANKLIYADKLDITDKRTFKPIGIHCRICEWQNCPDRTTMAVQNKNAYNPLSRGLSAFDPVNLH